MYCQKNTTVGTYLAGKFYFHYLQKKFFWNIVYSLSVQSWSFLFGDTNKINIINMQTKRICTPQSDTECKGLLTIEL